MDKPKPDHTSTDAIIFRHAWPYGYCMLLYIYYIQVECTKYVQSLEEPRQTIQIPTHNVYDDNDDCAGQFQDLILCMSFI